MDSGYCKQRIPSLPNKNIQMNGPNVQTKIESLNSWFEIWYLSECFLEMIFKEEFNWAPEWREKENLQSENLENFSEWKC